MAAQRSISASTTIEASEECVWDLLCDTSRYAEWVDSTLEVVRTDGRAAPGVTYDERTRIAGPWRESTHWRVAEFDPPHRQVHEGAGVTTVSGLAVVLELAPQGERTAFTLTYRFTPRFGVLGALIASAVTGTVTREQQRTVESFKSLVEHEASAQSVRGSDRRETVA